MQIEILTFCDNAQSYGGKLIIVGTFNRIASKNFPFRYPTFSIVGRFSFESSESGTKNFSISLRNQKGEDALPPMKIENQNIVVEDGKVGLFDVNSQLNQVEFKEPGVYLATLESEGIQQTIKLFVEQL